MEKINIYEAENLVRKMANDELIQDRVYELAQGLTEKYIEKVAGTNEIDGLDEYGSGEEWYDEVKEEAMHILFEKLSAFFRGEE